MRERPKLSAENVVDYLDWLTSNLSGMSAQHAALHMQAAELTVRTRMGEAQNKATQHTLVESGVIDPPPAPR